MGGIMLQLLNINKKFGDKIIFQNLTYNFVQSNCIYTIFGESGSGKTTLLNILYGIDQEFEGTYLINQYNTKDFIPHDWDEIRNKGLSLVFQDYKLLETLSIYQNLYCTCFLEVEDVQSRILEVLDVVDLTNEVDEKVYNLSGGQKQRLAIARAILNDSKIILLDEPTGNLDELNTKKIMEYIQRIKNNRIIIIMTHDQRLIEYSDVILRLEEHNLVENTEVRKNSSGPIKLYEMKYAKVKLLEYFKMSFLSRYREIILNNIPTILMISIFICVFTIVNITFDTQIKNLFQGLADDALYISTTGFSESYVDIIVQTNAIKSDDGERINFSDEDLEKVLDIEFVNSATLYNGVVTSLYDNEEYRLDLYWEKEHFPQSVREKASYGSSPKVIQFGFESMNIPYEYANKKSDIELMYGRFPKDSSDEILIPDILAYDLSTDIKQCINSQTIFNVYDINNSSREKLYTIVGIYKTGFDHRINDSYSIYVNYMEEDFLELFISFERYQIMKKNDYENNRFIQNYNNPIYDTFESYKNAIGTNLSDMIIVVESPDKVAYVQNELVEIFPNLKILSQYEFEYGETADAYNSINMAIKSGILILSIIIGVAIVLLNKNYIKSRNKELAILYAMGYSKSNMLVLITLEYILTILANTAVAYLILKIIQYTGFRSSELYLMYAYIFNLTYILQVLVFVIIMISLSVIVSFFGVNKNKLRNYLEGVK